MSDTRVEEKLIPNSLTQMVGSCILATALLIRFMTNSDDKFMMFLKTVGFLFLLSI